MITNIDWFASLLHHQLVDIVLARFDFLVKRWSKFSLLLLFSCFFALVLFLFCFWMSVNYLHKQEFHLSILLIVRHFIILIWFEFPYCFSLSVSGPPFWVQIVRVLPTRIQGAFLFGSLPGRSLLSYSTEYNSESEWLLLARDFLFICEEDF